MCIRDRVCLARNLEPRIPEESLVIQLGYHYEDAVQQARRQGQIKIIQGMASLLEDHENEGQYRRNRMVNLKYNSWDENQNPPNYNPANNKPQNNNQNNPNRNNNNNQYRGNRPNYNQGNPPYNGTNQNNNNYRGNGPNQHPNSHPNNSNYHGNNYNPNYQYNNRGNGGNRNQSNQPQVHFMRGSTQNNQGTRYPRPQSNDRSNNNAHSDNQHPREEDSGNVQRIHNIEGSRSGNDRDAPSGSNQQENENYDWIPFSDNPAEHFRVAYNKRNPPELWIPSRNNGNQSNTPQGERQEIDEEETMADRWNA